MGITGAGIYLGWQHMGNGANLAYRKLAFEAVGGYAGNEHISSGDDMFLIQKMAAKWPGSIGFLKNASAAVLTEAPATWRAFWHQRLRWGSKNAALPEWPIRIVLLVVWLFCWSIVVSVALVLAGRLSVQVLIFQLLVKLEVDWLLLRRMCRYFGRKDLLRWVFPAFFSAYRVYCGAGYGEFVGGKGENERVG